MTVLNDYLKNWFFRFIFLEIISSYFSVAYFLFVISLSYPCSLLALILSYKVIELNILKFKLTILKPFCSVYIRLLIMLQYDVTNANRFLKFTFTGCSLSIMWCSSKLRFAKTDLVNTGFASTCLTRTCTGRLDLIVSLLRLSAICENPNFKNVT